MTDGGVVGGTNPCFAHLLAAEYWIDKASARGVARFRRS